MVTECGRIPPPTSFDIENSSFAWGGYGKVSEKCTIINNPEAIATRVIEEGAHIAGMIQEDEAVRWFTMTGTQTSLMVEVYGEVYKTRYAESDAEYNSAEYLYFDTAEQLKSYNEKLDVGTILETGGYKTKGDGGAAKYKVAVREKWDFASLATATGQPVNIVVENQTINMRQLGGGLCQQVTAELMAEGYSEETATGNDDLARFNEAMEVLAAARGDDENVHSTVYFPPGEYRFYKNCNVGMSNLLIKGERGKSIIYTDNAYNNMRSEHFFVLAGCSNTTMDGIRIEARETCKRRYYRQLSVMYASDITIRNCEIYNDENVQADDTTENPLDRQFTNLTLYTGWKNITVDNCLLYNMAGVERGACLGILDIYGDGGENATITGNTMWHNCHDEMLGIFTAEKETAGINGVFIANNEMHATNSNASTRTMVMTFGYDSSVNVRNITFTGNHVIADVPSNMLTFGKTENCVIENNLFDVNSQGYAGVCFDTRKGVIVRNNTINIENEAHPESTYGTQVFKQYGTFIGNTVNARCRISKISYLGGNFHDNTFNLEHGCEYLHLSPDSVTGNTYNISGGFFENGICVENLSADLLVQSNTFNYLYDDSDVIGNYTAWQGSHIVSVGGSGQTKSYTVKILDNVVTAPNCSPQKKHILFFALNSDVPQHIVVMNSVLEKFSVVRSKMGQSLEDVIYAGNRTLDGQYLLLQNNTAAGSNP